MLENKNTTKYEVTMLGDKVVIVEGHKGIRTYAIDRVVLKVNKNYISILGNHLSIIEINDVDIIIKGDIKGVNIGEE